MSSGEQMVQAAQAEERSGEKRARGDGVSEEQTTGLTNPSSPLRYTVGVADRLCSASPLLCLSENIQNGNLTPLLKIAEFTRFQLEVPLLKCDIGEQIPRLISKRQHIKPGEEAQASSSDPYIRSLQEPRPRRARRSRPRSAARGARRLCLPRAAPCRERCPPAPPGPLLPPAPPVPVSPPAPLLPPAPAAEAARLPRTPALCGRPRLPPGFLPPQAPPKAAIPCVLSFPGGCTPALSLATPTSFSPSRSPACMQHSGPSCGSPLPSASALRLWHRCSSHWTDPRVPLLGRSSGLKCITNGFSGRSRLLSSLSN